MRFGSNGPRSIAVGHEFLKVGGDFGEQSGGQARGHCDDAGEDARQQAAQMAEGDGAIDPPRRLGRDVLRAGQIRCQGVEVVADHLGAGVLAGSEPSEARGVFEVQAMLDAFERLLDPPALVIEIGEGSRRIAFGVEQGCHEHAHLEVVPRNWSTG